MESVKEGEFGAYVRKSLGASSTGKVKHKVASFEGFVVVGDEEAELSSTSPFANWHGIKLNPRLAFLETRFILIWDVSSAQITHQDQNHLENKLLERNRNSEREREGGSFQVKYQKNGEEDGGEELGEGVSIWEMKLSQLCLPLLRSERSLSLSLSVRWLWLIWVDIATCSTAGNGLVARTLVQWAGPVSGSGPRLGPNAGYWAIRRHYFMSFYLSASDVVSCLHFRFPNLMVQFEADIVYLGYCRFPCWCRLLCSHSDSFLSVDVSFLFL